MVGESGRLEGLEHRASRRGARGALTLLVVALLFNLSLLGLVAMTYARSSYFRAVDETRRAEATWQAEGGLNLGLSQLSVLGSVSSLSLPASLVKETVMGEGSFRVDLVNNKADAGGAKDSDGLVVVRATGYSRGHASRRVLEATVSVGGGSLVPPAAMSLGANLTGAISGNVTISGKDLSGGATIGGVAFEVARQTVTTNGSVSVTGSPDYSWATASFATGGLGTQLQQAVVSYASRADAVHVSGNMKSTLGTPNVPQITVVDAGSSLMASGKVTGAGVLVVRGALHLSGQFDFDGLILVEGAGGELKMSGNSTIKGGIAFSPAPSGLSTRSAFALSGNTTVTWKKTAMTYASSALPSLTVRAFVLRN